MDLHTTVHPVPPELVDQYHRFYEYSRRFYTGHPEHDFHLDLKITHTLGVLAAAAELAQAEAAFEDPIARRALLLAALYHDIGRFPQLAQYHTFSDARSVNHGALGSRELTKQGFLRDEDPVARRFARSGVLLHNRHTLPKSVSGTARLVLLGVRDADKLDIMRVMGQHLGPGAQPDPVVVMDLPHRQDYSPTVLAALRDRRMSSFTDLTTTTDFALLVCGWFYGLHFPVSRKLAAKSSGLRAVIAGLPQDPEITAVVAGYEADLAAS